MHQLTFREIFQTTVEFFVDRIYHNYALQIIANSFLANPATSATFATILVEYLLERMEEMGSMYSSYPLQQGISQDLKIWFPNLTELKNRVSKYMCM